MHGSAWVLHFGTSSHSSATQPRNNSAGSGSSDGSRDTWGQLAWQEEWVEWEDDQSAMGGAARVGDDPMGESSNDREPPTNSNDNDLVSTLGNGFVIQQGVFQEDTFKKIEVSYAKIWVAHGGSFFWA